MSVLDGNGGYYGLEEHLEAIKAKWPKGELLHSAWVTDKAKLCERLKAVSVQYPHYSMHDGSHSEKIIESIEFFLGEERIRQLGATDTWMILEAAYSHDIGMAMPAADLLEELRRDKTLFQSIKKECMETLSLIEAFSSFESGSDWSLAVIGDLSAVWEGHIRPLHHKFSCKILEREAEDCELPSVFRPLRNMVATISYLHGEPTEAIKEKLDKSVNGACGDHLHPRFCAHLLRIGDLLDMGNGRFNEQLMKVAGYSEESALHKQKHDSIVSIRIDERKITVKADFRSKEGVDRKACVRAFRLLRGWMDMMDGELTYFLLHWHDIVPDKTGGICPRLDGCEYLIDGRQPYPDEDKLKFRMSGLWTTGIMEASGFYRHPGLAFLRELIQNALDHTKIQLFRDVCEERYIGFPEKHRHDVIKDISPYRFFQLLGEYRGKYRVDVRLQFECDENGDTSALVVRVRDYGAGITYEDLVRMQSVGPGSSASDGNDTGDMPIWLRPTGCFGIGLQSVFLVASSFCIITRPRGHDAVMGYRTLRKMTFESGKTGGNIYVDTCNQDEADGFGFGTEVVVRIPPEAFCRLAPHIQNPGGGNRPHCSSIDENTAIRHTIGSYVAEICKPIGIDVTLVQENPEGEKRDGSGMSEVFGKACLLLDDRGEPGEGSDPVGAPVDAPMGASVGAGFSVYSGREGILIRYLQSTVNAGETPEFYYKGIHVPDSGMALKLPFFKAEVHLLGDEPREVLQSNRDSFLPEKRNSLLSRVQGVHLRGMVRMVGELRDSTTRRCGGFDGFIKFSGIALLYMELFSCILDEGCGFSGLSGKGAIGAEPSTLDIFEFNASIDMYMLRETAMDAAADLLRSLVDLGEVWFYRPEDREALRLNTIKGFNGERPAEGKVVPYILPDYFHTFHPLAIQKDAILTTDNDRFLSRIYKLGPRAGLEGFNPNNTTS